jgi:two-component system sensor histidine kinase BaeS
MRRSLLARLSVLTLVVTVVSVGATAWLATLVLNRGIHQANGRSHAEVATVYRTLVRYGATHRGWAGVEPVVDALSRRTKQQIELTALSDRRLAVVRTGARTLPVGSPAAIVDPLHVDAGLERDAPASRIDSAAVGPLALTAADRAQLDQMAGIVLACVRAKAGSARIVVAASGRPEVVSPNPRVGRACGTAKLATELLPDQQPVIGELTLITDDCLKVHKLNGIAIAGDLSWQPSAPETAAERAATQGCLDSARREQLNSWVAPPAVLYLSVPTGQRRALVFTSHNELRIAEVVAAVIVLAMGATLLVGSRLVRPLRALTDAARGVKANGFTEVVEVSGNDEIAHLTRAFNQMVRTQTQMQEQRKAAISDIAHELRTPLANIRAWLEAARDGLADNDQELASSLLEEAMLLQRTVDDLQLLSLADAGQLQLHRQEIPLPPMLRQARAALSGLAEPAGITLNLTCPDIAVVVDPDRLRQIVQNLVSNAIRHSYPGGTVDIRATAEDGYLRVDVIDRGTGIAAADLPRIYDRFWRAEKSRSRAAGGSGLGLAIVRQLVEAHHGVVSARSTPGKETVLSVRIPTPVHPLASTHPL